MVYLQWSVTKPHFSKQKTRFSHQGVYDMTAFDHLKLIRREPRELARFRRYLASIGRSEMTELAVMHEADNGCCRREPWNRTLASIVAAVKNPVPLVAVNLDHRSC